MSPIISNKELSMFIISENTWTEKNIQIIENMVQNNETILICVFQKNNELVHRINKYFWPQVGDEKIIIFEMPEIKNLNLLKNSDFEIICHDCQIVNKSEDKIF